MLSLFQVNTLISKQEKKQDTEPVGNDTVFFFSEWPILFPVKPDDHKTIVSHAL